MKYVSARKIIQLGLVMSLATAVAGCSDGPSNGEVLDLIVEQQKKQTESLQQIGGAGAAKMFNNMIPVVKAVDVMGCEEIRENTYQCSLEISAEIGGKESSNVTTAFFAKRKDGSWSQMK